MDHARDRCFRRVDLRVGDLRLRGVRGRLGWFAGCDSGCLVRELDLVSDDPAGVPDADLLLPERADPVAALAPGGMGRVGLVAVTSIVPMFQARLKDLPTYSLDNPIGIKAIEDAEEMVAPLFIVLALLCVLAVVSLIVRFVRSSGTERLQLKWFTFAAVILVVSVFLEELFGTSGIFFSLGMIGLPIAMGMAILRYRLYEIDLIINRALVYGLLTGLSILLYLGIVFALQLVVDSFTDDSDLAVAASTLAVAALVRPLRARIQSFIDRRFYRRKYNSTQALSGFAGRLRDEVDLNVVQEDVLSVLKDTVQPSHASVWLATEQSSGMNRRYLAWSLWLLFVGVLVVATYFGFNPPDDKEPIGWIDALWAWSFLGFPTTGALIAARFPDRPLGWLFCIGPLLIMTGVVISDAAIYTGAAEGGEQWFALGQQRDVLGRSGVVLRRSLLPSGRIPRRRDLDEQALPGHLRCASAYGSRTPSSDRAPSRTSPSTRTP